MSERYRDTAARSGRSFPAGRNQCFLRWMQIGKTEEAALERILARDLDIWKNFYASMGRRKVENNDYFGSLVNSGLLVFGTVDSVRRQLIEQWMTFPAEYWHWSTTMPRCRKGRFSKRSTPS
jgi:hypothetical protein